MEFKLKKTIVYTNDPRVKPDKNGNLQISVLFHLTREEVERVFEPDADHQLADVLQDGASGRLVSWMLSPNKWDKLADAHLVPTWYGEFTFGIVRAYARDYKDAQTGESKVSLDAEIVPLKSEGGTPIGKVAEFYTPPAKKEPDPEEGD